MRRHYGAPVREKQAPPLKATGNDFDGFVHTVSSSFTTVNAYRASVQPVRVSVLNRGFNLLSRFACDDLVFKDVTIGRQLRTIDLVIVFPQPGTDQGLTAMEERLPNCYNQ